MKITVKQIKRIIKEEIQRLSESQCPCGIERDDCEYHAQTNPSQGYLSGKSEPKPGEVIDVEGAKMRVIRIEDDIDAAGHQIRKITAEDTKTGRHWSWNFNYDPDEGITDEEEECHFCHGQNIDGWGNCLDCDDDQSEDDQDEDDDD